MKTEFFEIVKLTADKGKVLTNGTIYGKVIALGNGDGVENYYEISEKEYEEIVKKEENNNAE